jgi:D-lactate dehydrogenase
VRVELATGGRDELASLLAPERVLTRAIDRIAWANDASVYRLVPAVVVEPRTVAEVRSLLAFSRRRRMPLTFRAAGTSLSGQAVTDGVLAVLARAWRSIEVLDGGRRVRVEPGAIGGLVNRHLAPHGRKIGPDPASIDACMMGGILANNSSGMCCGVAHNAYHTLESLRFVLPDGLELDTDDPGAARALREGAPWLAEGLLELKREVESDPELAGLVRAKYRMKNTMGYSLNALLDYAEPLDILAHLMIGSEGTLGFIAGAVLRTIPAEPLRYTGLLFFRDVPSACGTIAALRDSGARALELMDRASLRAIEDQPAVPSLIRELPANAAGLLVEYQCASREEQDAARRACDALLPALPIAADPEFTTDPARQAALWQVRKGLIPSVGSLRRRGTSFIIEDVVFPVARLAQGVAELQELFGAHGYGDAIVFGHAKDGNLHFVLTQAFDDPDDVARYDAFMRALATLVAGRHGGALKAEHGTGRNMAPFVEAEWGRAAYAVHRSIKRLIDPDGLLNPGVIVNEDPQAHVRHLKPLPAVEAEVDACIECGFCERLCPSRDLTLTPRQRIVVRREMSRRRAIGDAVGVRDLARDYRYDALDTCAADGLCATACPVGIDTGALVRRLRGESRSAEGGEIARLLAERFTWVERAARGALRLLALVRRDLPMAANGPLPATARRGAAALYFPSCVTRVIGGPAEALVGVARRAGVPVWIPPDAPGHCCGLPFASKGYATAAAVAVNRAVESLWRWSDEGALPVVVDTSPCAYALRRAGPELSTRNRERLAALRVLDSIEFAHDRLLPRLEPTRAAGAIALHPVCSAVKLGLAGKLTRIGEACAERAIVPLAAGCCGFAGDRGFVVPELTAAATRGEVAEIAAAGCRDGYSSSRTCEIGLTRAGGRPFRSFWHLLDDATVDRRC